MKTILIKRWQIQLSAIALLLFSCKDDNVIVPPDTEEPSVWELNLGSRKVVEFRSIEDSKETGALADDTIEEHFGSRVQSFIPTSVVIRTDSTTFFKAGSLEEKFRTKWENNNELHVYDENSGTWRLLGKKVGDAFLLTAAFFSKKTPAEERVSTILGQAYALDNYDTLLAPNEQYTLIWLRIEAAYQ